VIINLTLSVDEEVVAKARKRAEAMGTSVNQLVREYLDQLAGSSDGKAVAAEIIRLSLLANGASGGKKFNREDAYEGRL
jgi:hypothetical protein